MTFSSAFRAVFILSAAFSLLLRCDAMIDEKLYPGMNTEWGFAEELSYWNPFAPDDDISVLPEFDFVVVGGGSAGAVVANRLSEIKDWTVLLIEAGPEATHLMDIPLVASLMQRLPINWQYTTVPMNGSCLGFQGRRCTVPRGKVMGGSSTLNYMIYTRGNRKDYDRWKKLGNTGWGYNDVLKYFKKSENASLSNADEGYHGKGGYMSVNDVPYKTPIANAFVKAGEEIGMPVVDVNGKSQIGVNYVQATMRGGRRCSTNKAFIEPAINRQNLYVKTLSTVTRVLINDETKEAEGVEFVRLGQRYRVFVKKEVIVSGGAINTPQLLMLSGVGPREHLASMGLPVIRDLPVGENLMDHVTLSSLGAVIDGNSSLKLKRILSNPRNMDDYLKRNTGPFTVPGGAEALAFADVRRQGATDGLPDLELLLLSGQFASAELSRTLYGFHPDVYAQIFRRTPRDPEGFTVFPVVMRPRSRGTVRLANVSPFQQPLINPGYFSDPADLDVIVAGVRLFQRMLRTDAMSALGARLMHNRMPGCMHHLFDSDKYWKCCARVVSFSMYHMCGTCKMAPVDDPTAVVDARLRVHGVSKLRVIDASVMPEIPAAHINAPTMMIAEKGSDMIKEDWGALERDD